MAPPLSVVANCGNYTPSELVGSSFSHLRDPRTPRASIASADRSDLNAALVAQGLLPGPASSLFPNFANNGLAPQSSTTGIFLPEKKQAAEDEEEGDVLDDDDDDDVEDDEEDDKEDDDDDDRALAGKTERMFAEVVHVGAPTKPPTTAAFFTHCQYSYIGSGRWQVYLQMWFVEERLKREVSDNIDFGELEET